jgi:hypothetical protein
LPILGSAGKQIPASAVYLGLSNCRRGGVIIILVIVVVGILVGTRKSLCTETAIMCTADVLAGLLMCTFINFRFRTKLLMRPSSTRDGIGSIHTELQSTGRHPISAVRLASGFRRIESGRGYGRRAGRGKHELLPDPMQPSILSLPVPSVSPCRWVCEIGIGVTNSAGSTGPSTWFLAGSGRSKSSITATKPV